MATEPRGFNPGGAAADSGDGALITHAPRAPAGGAPADGGAPAPGGFDLSFFSPAEDDDGAGDVGADEGTDVDDGGGVPAQNVQPAPAGAAPQPSPAPAPLTGEALQALMQGNQQLAESIRQLVATQTAPKPDTTPKPPKVYVTPEAIPAPMQALMNSEDPAERIRGIAAFGNALVTAVLAQVEQDVSERYQPDFTRQYEEAIEQRFAARQWEDSFNQDYPNLLNDPKGKLVAQVAISQAAQQLQAQGVPAQQIVWANPKYREAFNAILLSVGYRGGVVKPLTPATGADPNNPPAQRPAPMGRRQGARPADPGGGQSQFDQMLAVLGTVANGRR